MGPVEQRPGGGGRTMMAKQEKKASTGTKVIRKAKATVAGANPPVRPGSTKALYFAALHQGGTVDAVMARLKGKVKGKVTPAKVQKFGGWALKRGLITANKANGTVKYTPGTATLELKGKKQ